MHWLSANTRKVLITPFKKKIVSKKDGCPDISGYAVVSEIET